MHTVSPFHIKPNDVKICIGRIPFTALAKDDPKEEMLGGGGIKTVRVPTANEGSKIFMDHTFQIGLTLFYPVGAIMAPHLNHQL